MVTGRWPETGSGGRAASCWAKWLGRCGYRFLAGARAGAADTESLEEPRLAGSAGRAASCWARWAGRFWKRKGGGGANSERGAIRRRVGLSKIRWSRSFLRPRAWDRWGEGGGDWSMKDKEQTNCHFLVGESKFQKANEKSVQTATVRATKELVKALLSRTTQAPCILWLWERSKKQPANTPLLKRGSQGPRTSQSLTLVFKSLWNPASILQGTEVSSPSNWTHCRTV